MASQKVFLLTNKRSDLKKTLISFLREAIVTLMDDMTVGHFMVESTGALTELDKVKLSGRVPGHNGVISWAGQALAILTGILYFLNKIHFYPTNECIVLSYQ